MQRKTCASLWVGILVASSLTACSTSTNTSIPFPVLDTHAPQGGETASVPTQAASPLAPLQNTPTGAANPTPTAGLPAQPDAQPSTESAAPPPIDAQADADATPTLVCDHAVPANPLDITVPDGSVLAPGDHFTKIWRLANSGACVWTTGYSLVWFSGERFGAGENVPLIQAVNPGETVDLVIDMTAPPAAGVYQSNWKLQNESGQLFGIGPNGDSPIWVRIVVSSPQTETPAPSPTPTPTQVVLAQWQVNLVPGEELDLDDQLQSSAGAPDLIYRVAEDEALQLNEENGGLLGSLLPDPPTSLDCSAGLYLHDPLPVTADTQGYACALTSQGLPAQLHLRQVLPDQTLSLEITVWPAP